MDYQMVRIFQFLQAKSDIYKKQKTKKTQTKNTQHQKCVESEW